MCRSKQLASHPHKGNSSNQGFGRIPAVLPREKRRMKRTAVVCQRCQWFDLPDRDRYYYKDNEDWHHIEFNFKFLAWIDVWVKDKQCQVWQVAGILSLAITQEERLISRSDWGPIDGAAKDPTSSEPENIDIWAPRSDHSDNESEKSEDVHIPLTDIEAREEESLQVFIYRLNTEGIPTLAPRIPRPPSWNTWLPSITVTLMATTT